MSIPRRGLCLVIAAPSGAGKTSLTRALLAAEPSLTLSISVTTRAPRAGEQDGVHYHFIDQPAFDAMAAQGALLEHAGVFGRSYGSPAAPVLAALAAGRDVVFDIDWQGHRQMRAVLPDDVVGLFILPPSHDALQSRLTGRGDPPAMVESRMAHAESEMSHAGEFDHVLVNDDFADALTQMRAVLAASRLATARATGLPAFLSALAKAG
jgi:guanylate kinase